MRLLVQELALVTEQFSADVQTFLEHGGQSSPGTE